MMADVPLVDPTDIGPLISAVYNTAEGEVQVTADRDVALSETMVTTASNTGDDVSVYQLKWVEWKGKFAPIITQNENGPCPLLALCNVLVLSGRMKIPAGETIVSSTHLMDLLGHCLIDNVPQDLAEGERANYEQNIQDAMAVFPKLQTGLDVNVKFDSVDGFEFTSESGLFDLLGVPLYHGWLADPQDELAYSVVSECSYNQLVEKVISDKQSSDTGKVQQALIGEQFLESTATQLTYHGLCELTSAVREGELCVFFRNNHFSTILKRKDQLLLLVTDHGFVNELGHVWQLLNDIDGDGDFLDDKFLWSTPSDTQRQREEASGVGAEKDQPEGTDTETTGLDYQIALGLQQEDGGEEHAEQQTPDHDPHLEGGPPSTTKEDYEREASMYHKNQSKNNQCTVL